MPYAGWFNYCDVPRCGLTSDAHSTHFFPEYSCKQKSKHASECNAAAGLSLLTKSQLNDYCFTHQRDLVYASHNVGTGHITVLHYQNYAIAHLLFLP